MSDHTDVVDALDVVVIGGGQAALSVAYFLRRTSLSYVLLDAEDAPGGAWRHGWSSLRLFSPAQASSLSGWPMPPVSDGFPTRDHVIDYPARYEGRYQIPVVRPVWVNAVERGRGRLLVRSVRQSWPARAVVSATGTWRAPFLLAYPGREAFAGTQLHSADYVGPESFAGRRVLVVGGGNSEAQVLAELSTVPETVWVSERPPRFLPDGVDGGVLFRWSSERRKAQQEGRPASVPEGGLGDIVMVPPVVEAWSRGVLVAREPFDHFTTAGGSDRLSTHYPPWSALQSQARAAPDAAGEGTPGRRLSTACPTRSSLAVFRPIRSANARRICCRPVWGRRRGHGAPAPEAMSADQRPRAPLAVQR